MAPLAPQHIYLPDMLQSDSKSRKKLIIWKKKIFFLINANVPQGGWGLVKNIELRKAQLFLAFASILTILLHYILYNTARHVHFEFMHKVKKPEFFA